MSTAFGVVMAGGSGTRFWPMSRAKRPKQLLALGASEKSLLRLTVDRLAKVVPHERILIVTAEILADATRAELPELPRANVLAEPMGRNTAPCVAWAAVHAHRLASDASLVVVPADQHIAPEESFAQDARDALAAAEDGHLVTIGIKPTRPETGYGYIELGEALSGRARRVARFVEKPTRDKAEAFLRAGNYMWNSGMFFFRADAVLEATRKHLPALATGLDEVARQKNDADVMAAVRRVYPTLPSISIDHGIMEKAERVAVVPASFEWSDVGSWQSAWELSAKDAADNSTTAESVVVDSKGCLVRAPAGKVVALVGVTDLVVVDTGDALLVMPRERSQDVREVVEALKARNDKEHL